MANNAKVMSSVKDFLLKMKALDEAIPEELAKDALEMTENIKDALCDEDPEVREVLKFIYGLKPDSGIALEMDEAASLAKQKSDLEDEYMYFSDILEDEKEEARAEGHALGHSEGHAEGLEAGRRQQKIESAMEAARNAISLGLTEQQVATISGLSVEDVKSLMAQTGC